MDREIEYAQELKKQFLEEKNKPFKENEYYLVIMNIDYDSYDSIMLTTTRMFVEVPSIIETTERGLFGPKKVIKETMCKEPIGIYAIKNRNGIFEMTTGRKLSVSGEANSIHCFGINKLTNNSLVDVSKDLQLLESKPLTKKQYINMLLSFSDIALKRQKVFAEAQKENDYNMQYLKKYKLPNN